MEQIINEAYDNFIHNPDYKAKCVADLMGSQAKQLFLCPTKEEFVNKCKTDSEFSEKWGLKIEERELSFEERHMLWDDEGKEANVSPFMEKQLSSMLDKENIPTKLITLTYNNEIIEIHEYK